jgi:hypothetical protein
VPFTPAQCAELERLGLSEVRLHYERAGMDDSRTVATLLDGGMLRRDVGAWIAEKEREAQAKADQITAKSQHIQAQTLRWAKAAAWIGVAGIVVAIILAFVGK